MENPGLLPVIRLDSCEKLPDLLHALLAGGITCAELTMTMPDAVKNLARMKKQFDGEMLLGMGTVLSAEDAVAALDAGADFLVSPVPVPEMPALAHAREVPAVAGAFTPFEVLTAHRSGADFVKIFPLNIAGPGYIKDLLGPMPFLKIFPTGGVNLETIPMLVKNGVRGCGVGSALVRKDLVANCDWGTLTALAKQYVAAITAARMALV